MNRCVVKTTSTPQIANSTKMRRNRSTSVKCQRLKRCVDAQCLYQRLPSAFSQVIAAKVELRKRCVDAQFLCQRPPSAFSQVIVVKVERRNCGVEAQCLCQRSVKVERRDRGVTVRPLPVGEMNSAPRVHNRICLFYGRAHRLRRLLHPNFPARGQHLVVDSGCESAADPASNVTGFSPYLLYYNSAPPLEQLYAFGSFCTVHLDADHIDPLRPNIRAASCIYLCRAHHCNSQGHIVWDYRDHGKGRKLIVPELSSHVWNYFPMRSGSDKHLSNSLTFVAPDFASYS